VPTLLQNGGFALNPTVSGVWTAADNGRGNVEAMASGTFSGGTVIGGGINCRSL
jgi:hypothetical protein